MNGTFKRLTDYLRGNTPKDFVHKVVDVPSARRFPESGSWPWTTTTTLEESEVFSVTSVIPLSASSSSTETPLKGPPDTSVTLPDSGCCQTHWWNPAAPAHPAETMTTYRSSEILEVPDVRTGEGHDPTHQHRIYSDPDSPRLR